MSKTFLEIFNKYKPDGEVAEILETAQNIRIQADKAACRFSARLR